MTAPRAPIDGIARLACRLAPWYRWFARTPEWFLQIFARLAIAPMFWLSGETKVNALDCLTDLDCTPGGMAVMLFREEYRLPLLDPHLAAALAAFAEHVFPLMLVLGIGTRIAAAGLLAMTLVIQIFVYPEWLVFWNTHVMWAFPLFYVLARGPGPVSLDHLVVRRCMPRGA